MEKINKFKDKLLHYPLFKTHFLMSQSWGLFTKEPFNIYIGVHTKEYVIK